MADQNSFFQPNLYLSPEQQDLLLTALSSNHPPRNQDKTSPLSKAESGHASSFLASPAGVMNLSHEGTTPFGFADDDGSFLDFSADADFDFRDAENLFGDIPGSVAPEANSEEPETAENSPESREKRKDLVDGKSENNSEETGKKRKESDDKGARKPGRKPLTSEPTSKRKAQNRAAQRAFRERKEKHLKDLETKVEELQKASDAANQENGLLRAQIERLRVELREYRKRLSWMASGSGLSAMSTIPSAHSKGVYGLSNSEFLFDFPKFGGMPGAQPLGNGHATKTNSTLDLGVAGRDGKNQVPGILGLDGLGNSAAQRQTALSHSPNSIGPSSYHRDATAISSSSTSTAKGYGPSNNLTAGTNPVSSKTQPSKPSAKDTPNSGSPSSCSDSHQSQVLSSSRTSPEPDLNSSSVSKSHDVSIGHSCGLIDGERSFCEQLGLACGNVNNPIPPIRRRSSTNSHTASQPPSTTEPPLGLDWFAQQNGGQFDPVLFGDWREPQDAVLSQDFGDFFNDAFNIPELENEPDHKQPPKHDLVAQIDKKMDEDEEVVPGEDKSQLWTCTKIWDRLQSMEKFRNGEIDVDLLCSELRTKAQCSEGGVVVNQKDVDSIMGRVGACDKSKN